MSTLKKYAVHIKSLTPFIMCSDRLVNQLDPLTKEKKAMTSLKSKQDEHLLALAKIEWIGALYYDESLGLYIPSKCLRACFKAAAKKFKKGMKTKAITFDAFLGSPIIGYEGMTPEKLWEKKNKNGIQSHVHAVSVVINKSRVISTKPILHQWETKFVLHLNTEILSLAELEQIMSTAGFEYGIGAERPERATGNYGQFSIEEVKEIKK